MIKIPTVLVLGAGASTDYGYPTGPGLRDTILDDLADSDSTMYNQLRSLAQSVSGIEHFRQEFADSQLPTIDQFLEGHSEFADVGTRAIACGLLPYERSDTHPLQESESLERRGDRPTWYDYLWDELRQDIENFTDNKLTIVTFNYDRSLEQYLGRALQVTGVKDISKRMSSLGFIHVYGTLGGRPYIDKGARGYGDIEESALIIDAARGIKIIDRNDDPELLSQFELAKKALSNAKRVVMLGFGYDATNVERLGLRESVQGRDAGVLGTAWKMPIMERKKVEQLVGLEQQLTLVDVDCLGMFEHHFSF